MAKRRNKSTASMDNIDTLDGFSNIIRTIFAENGVAAVPGCDHYESDYAKGQ